MKTTSEAPVSMRIPGPPFTAKLSAFDARHSGFYSRRILVFRANVAPHKKIIHVLSRALECLVQKVPILGGQVTLTNDSPTGQKGWKMVTAGKGILLHAKSLKMKYQDLEATNFAPTSLPDHNLIPVPIERRPEPYDIAEFQLNFIEGGILLACCICHIAADGPAQTTILRLLADYCKRASRSSLVVPIEGPPLGLDRTPMLGLRTQDGSWAREDHPAMTIKKPGEEQYSEAGRPPTIPVIYRIDANALAQLKADASTENLRISTNDAIMSILWHAIFLNRVASGALEQPQRDEKLASLFFPLSARRLLGLSPEYIGNTVCNRLCTAPVSQALAPDYLQILAAIHRKEVNRVDRDLVAGYCQMTESAPSMGDFVTTLRPTMSSTGIVLTSCYHSSEEVFATDWGDLFGNYVQRLRCGSSGFSGALQPVNFILPRMSDGSCEVQLSLCENGIPEMEKDDIFSKYLKR